MSQRNEQHAKKFCYKLGKTATETREMLMQLQVYGVRLGRPSTNRTPEMMEKVRQMLAEEGGHQRYTFFGRKCHQRSCDSRSAIIRFADCSGKLYERCQACVVADGDYFEG